MSGRSLEMAVARYRENYENASAKKHARRNRGRWTTYSIARSRFAFIDSETRSDVGTQPLWDCWAAERSSRSGRTECASARELVVVIAEGTGTLDRRRVVWTDADTSAELCEVAVARLAQSRFDVVVPLGLGDVGLNEGVYLVRVVQEELDDFFGDE